jgi:large subunit ribosomal protein L13
MKTPTVSPAQIEASRKWYVIDGDGLVLGRLATTVAQILIGKNKPMYTPHLDTGDFVVIINADRVRLTGRKEDLKSYFHHTGYPGHHSTEAFKDLKSTKPEWVLEHAIKGMLPHNRLGRKMLKKVRIYKGEEHPHAAQKPETMELK